ncbi:hypothetical protein LTR91_003857 [Friedmanniomyces endolithicus]|uniref:Uncharacterized protein n=1 Tax=Friedmanniomyces endolithicus TaxID=329885 RepID=A0AAN6KWB9_9PEZI|nr:hypothetical protein LTR35_007311 [Friedmanniomyces endolithicus]KAK0297375.1 hypothetical protein LTS00_004098 [Friedmanniomyces endolithicus]KAK0315485.1 hypothetical protein LTR01_000783 [Friedmanniomyces endolithicus]KAK0827021.1 hypothetical protein LTR73_005804 [Friedmanniomyces endolithicus]KAK0927334.1 hypothetical protein LTR57_003497 [Friedmanniomyces endolithicus]
MALKRKRSSISFSSLATVFSTSTDFPSTAIPSYYPQQKPTPAFYEKQTWAFPTYDDGPSAQHLNSRTRKRHRDDRPDEQQVHGVSCWLGAVIQMSMLADACRAAASTINRLYDAQRKHLDAEPVLSSQSVPPAAAHEKPQKSTLHAFWSLPSPPARTDGMQLDSGSDRASDQESSLSRCEDCERPLREEDAMEVDDVVLEQDTACAMCRRRVCGLCSIAGAERLCLSCACVR